MSEREFRGEHDIGEQGHEDQQGGEAEAETDPELQRKGDIGRLEEMRQMKRMLDELLDAQVQSTSAITHRTFKKRREKSPMHSNPDSASSYSQANEVTKELIKLIPRYDGSGGIQKFFRIRGPFRKLYIKC